MARVESTMAGTVFKVLVTEGQAVKPEDDVIILESMKMEVPITADVAGTVMRVMVQEGDFLNEGDLIVEIG